MTNPTNADRAALAQPKGSKRVARAKFVLFWERLWPAVLPLFALPTLIIIISLFDGWRLVPVWAHWLALGLTALGFVALAARRLRPLAWPTDNEAVARIEADSRFRHAPLQALDDHVFDGDLGQRTGPQADADNPLWQRHLADMEAQARRARLKGGYGTAETADPFALRFVLAGLVLIGVIAAGDLWRFRLAAGVQPGTAGQTIASRADVWIDPPAYTGLAPIYLLRAGGALPDLAAQENVPEGAVLTALINGERGADLSFTRGDGTTIRPDDTASDEENEAARAPSKRRSSPGRNQAEQLALTLGESGVVQLRLAGRRGLWPINVEADTPPVVAFVEEPSINDKRQIGLYYTFTDDYGAASAEFVYRLDPDQDRPLDAPNFDAASLEERRVKLIEGAAGPGGERKTVFSVDEDPWAGLNVLARLEIIDGAGQRGVTEEVALTLPNRLFFNPLAKAVIEQRQSLAVAGEAIQRVRDAFTAVTLMPEDFFDDTAEYLLLSTANWRVQTDNDGNYQDTVDHFWPLALELEDQALELARRRLDAAIEALREALEQDASDTVIDQRRAAVEQAIEDYITALAQSGAMEEGGGEGSNQLGANQLEEMLEAIGDLSRSGAKNAARQLLSDLENILESLRLSQGGGGGSGTPNPNGDPSAGQNDGPGEQAGELIGRQRELSDRAFEEGQQSDGPSSDGQSSDDQSTDENSTLADDQGTLADDTRELLESLAGEGQGAQLDPVGAAAEALEDAIREMQRAEGALENGDYGRANSAMERAIGKLRDGAQELAEAQAAQEGQGQSAQEGQADGENTDPLGRSTGGIGSGNIAVPDAADPARARDVIEELRRRLGEQGRSDEEIEYLERLLDAF